MTVYYNDNDSHSCQWTRNLIEAGYLPDGVVDERSIEEVRPSDVERYEWCNFFNGYGGWPYSLGLAEWTGPVWSASLPCQPFSAAGKQKADEDERHLWPVFFRLVGECRPPVLFGEQTASNLGRQWVTRVRSDLEALGYAVGIADLCAAGASAPHLRQRLYWVAYANGTGQRPGLRGVQEPQIGNDAGRGSETGRMDQPIGQRWEWWQGTEDRRLGDGCDARRQQGPDGSLSVHEGRSGRLGEPSLPGLEERGRQPRDDGSQCPAAERASGEPDGLGDPSIHGRRQEHPLAGWGDQGSRSEERQQRPWDDFDVIPCRDGKARRTQRGLFPLVAGLPFRLADGGSRKDVSRKEILKGIGNSIVPEVAVAFIQASQDFIRKDQDRART